MSKEIERFLDSQEEARIKWKEQLFLNISEKEEEIPFTNDKITFQGWRITIYKIASYMITMSRINNQ